MKFNAALERLPTWTAAPGEDWPARATIDATGTMEEAQRAFEACERGEPAVAFGEIYIQTGYDPSPAPEGKHLLSVFGQYAPYDIADGDWDARRDDVARQFIDLIARFAPDVEDCLVEHEVLGPPDIESRIGLTGGNIFQGEVTPDQMWEHRLTSRTPVPGLYLCGAATHPAGSVIALNGRNAAEAVLADCRPAPGSRYGRREVQSDARERILEAACDLIAEDGIDDVRIARVAMRAGVVDRARPPLLLDPGGAARAGAHPLVQPGRRRALRRRAAGRDGRRRRLARAIRESLPLPGPQEREWVLWVELWLRAVRDPGLRPVAARLYERYRAWLEGIIRAGSRAASSVPTSTWPARPTARWRCSTAPGCECCSATRRWTSTGPTSSSPRASRRSSALSRWRSGCKLNRGSAFAVQGWRGQALSPRPQIEHIRKPQILSAAAEVIAERGLASTRIADVAERAGTSAPAVLYWFENKDMMLAEALTFDEDRFDAALEARLATLTSPAAKLVALIEACANDYDWRLWVELWPRSLQDAGTAKARQELDDRWRELIADLIRDGKAAGEFRDCDPEQAALALAALIDGLSLQVTLRDPAFTPARMYEICIASAERLLGARLPGAPSGNGKVPLA